MTESISTPNALVQTQNGKRFYVYSGQITAAGSGIETTMVDIANIGERDVKLHLEYGHLVPTSADVVTRVYINDIIIYIFVWGDTGGSYGAMFGGPDLIIPANCKLVITFASSGTPVWAVAGSGKYV